MKRKMAQLVRKKQKRIQKEDKEDVASQEETEKNLHMSEDKKRRRFVRILGEQ